MSTTKPAPFEPARKVYSLWTEFRKFAFKGNLIDLAIGVVIGAAFAKVIDSLVKHIIMPLIGLILPSGQQSYEDWTIALAGGEIPVGKFLAELFNFVIVAFAIYLFMVKFLSWVMRSHQEEDAGAAKLLTKDQELLTEIRDLLKGTRPEEAPGRTG